MAAPERTRDAEHRLKLEVAHEARRNGDVGVEGRPEATSGTFATPNVDRRHTRDLVVLAWPIATAMLGETAMGLVDTKLASGLGRGALGGVGLGATLMFLGYAFIFGLMRGVKVCTSHAIGEGRGADGYAYARAGIVLGASFGLIQLFACRDVSGLLQWLGTDPSVVPFASEFLSAVTLGAPATCALAALIQHRQAMGDSRTPMVVGIAGNVFNGTLAWAMIYGHLGFSARGVRGGGYATAITEALELLALYALLVREEKRSRERTALTVVRAAREVAAIGGPSGVQYAAEMVAFTTFTTILGAIGADELAAHQIALNIIRVSFLPGVAVAEAASVLVGQSLGRRDVTGAEVVTRSAIRVAVGFMAGCGVLFGLFGGPLADFFTHDTAAAAITRRLLLVAAVFQVLDAVNIVLRGALRGAKDVRAVMVIGVLVVWACVPTAAYVLGKRAGLGALGGWLGFVAETTLSAGLFWLRWKRGAWRTTYADARAAPAS